MKEIRFALAISVLILFISCEKKDGDGDDAPIAPQQPIPVAQPSFVVDSLPYVQGFFKPNPVKLADIVNISEASGLDISLGNTSYLWTHMDSQSGEKLFLLNKQTGEWAATYSISSTINIDWEDMAVGEFGGNKFVYIADIGNNLTLRPSLNIYKFSEPLYDATHFRQDVSINASVQSIQISYPNGEKYDSEAMIVDPANEFIYIFTKQDGTTRVYVLQGYQAGSNNVMQLGAILPINRVTSADVSQDGKRLIIRNSDHIFYWEKSSLEEWYEVFNEAPLRLPYNGQEPQGEALCWDGLNYFTLSEEAAGITPALYRYETL